MKRILTLKSLLLTLFIMVTLSATAQEPTVELKPKVKFELGVDLLSRMLWHGYQVGRSPAITPLAFMYYRNFTLELNGTYVGANDYAETNFNVHYQLKNVKFSLLNYIVFNADSVNGKVIHFDKSNTPHVGDFEVNYMHPTYPVTLRLSSIVWGGDYNPGETRNRYSTYAEFGYTFKTKKVEILPYVAATPWKGMYADGAKLTNVGVKAMATLPITKNFSVPLRFEMTYNTFHDKVYVNFVARISTGILD